MTRTKKSLLILISLIFFILAACANNNDDNNNNGDDNGGGNENASDIQTQTEVDSNQLPISTIRTDKPSSEGSPDTQQIGFNRNGDRGMEDNQNKDGGNWGSGSLPDKDGDNPLEQQLRDRDRQEQMDEPQQEQNWLERNERNGQQQDDQNEGQTRQNQDQQQQSDGQNNQQQQPDGQNNQQTQQQGISEHASKVIELTNQERSRKGLSTLKVDKSLSQVARNKSDDMQQNNYFSHTSPTYGSPFDMMNEFGVDYQTAGENIARGQQSAQQVVDSWMDSEGHRKNIMDERFTHIGVGYTTDGNYWTQMFIQK